ncbi:MAG TPA: right-handed parallel beta-helix repeat-containing protein [Solirubrobacterales bacterium]
MKHRFGVFALLLGLCLAVTGLSAQALAKPGHHEQAKPKAKVFEACKHGCRYRKIQQAVDAAGSYKFKNPKVKTIVAIRPGKYVEGVLVDGTERRKDFNDLTIEGTKKDRRKTILEGKNAKGELGAAQNGIEAVSVDGIVLKNMWARNYQSNGFFVHAAREEGQHCDGYTMDNLLASANRSYGLFAKNCLGGKMIDSAGYHQGDSAFYVGETPCDSQKWTNHGSAPVPCQKKPKWTLLKNDQSYENVLGYSGTNSKYVKIVDSAFYNNGAGIVPNTLDSEGYEPNGWNVFERNDVFWNNYNYFLSGSSFHTVSAGLGTLAGAPINYPTGVGIILYGSANTIVRYNNVFGNYKWGISSFSGPGETFVANEGNDAKNINNQIYGNVMGREGADPNGEYDFWNDDTGGGNCWAGNSANSTFAPGNGKVPLSQIYPGCPQPEVLTDSVPSINTNAGLQVILSETGNPATILGYAGTSPPQNQQCSWVRRVASHPPFEKYKPVEVAPQPGEVTC